MSYTLSSVNLICSYFHTHIGLGDQACCLKTICREVKMMRKEIVLLLVAAVLLLGGAVALFETPAVTSWNLSVFDSGDTGGGSPLQPDGDPMPTGPL